MFTATTNSLSGIVFTKNLLSLVVKKKDPLLPSEGKPLKECTFPAKTELRHSDPRLFKYCSLEIWLNCLMRLKTLGA